MMKPQTSSLALGLLLAACQTAPPKPAAPAPIALAQPAPAPVVKVPPKPAPPAPPTPALVVPKAVAAAAPAAPGPKAGDRTGDGIDDENWLPRKDTPAYSAFLAAVEVARKDAAAAVPRFVDAANKSTGFYAAWFNAGAAAEAAHDDGSAERHYRQALAVRPDYGPALANLSSLLVRKGRALDAGQLIDDALRRFPEKAGPHLAAATDALANRELVKAEEEARAAMRYDERNVPAMLLMARVFRAQARYDTARFAVDNALALEPGNALLHLERGSILQLQGENKDAVVAFERAARLRPNLAEAQEGYGSMLLLLGFGNEARGAFEALVRLEPKSAAAQLHLGNAYRATKMYSQAEVAYRRALDLDKTLVEARFNLGVLYIDDVMPGVEESARLRAAVRELKLYKEQARPDAATGKRLDDYLEATEKRIVKEQKRKEREEKRKMEESQKPPVDAAPKSKDAAAASDVKKSDGEKSPAPPTTTAPKASSGNPEAPKGVDDK